MAKIGQLTFLVSHVQSLYFLLLMCAFSSTTKQLTQFWQYLSGDSIRSHRLRAQSHKTASDTRHKSRLSPVLLTDWL